MANINKIIMSLFVIMMVIFFYVGCSSSQEKPPEEEIKGIIITMELDNNINNQDISNLIFDNFQITNGFVSKTPGGGGESSPYCIEVNYKISYTLTINNVKTKQNKIMYYQQQMPKIPDDPDYTPGGTDQYLIKYYKKCIEDVKQMPDIEKVKKEIVRDNIRLSFVKKGERWYGYKNWM